MHLKELVCPNTHPAKMQFESDLQLPEKVLKYEAFINDVLKEDLKKVHARQDHVTTEIAEYIQLKNTIQTLKEADMVKDGFKAKMNLGCNFYVQANVSDPKTMFIDIGLGHYLEFTLDEAQKFIDRRLELLCQQSNKLKKDSAQTKAMIKMVLGGLHQLQSESGSAK
ncbi:protein UXT homolog [Schistocerca gregaria]|uniref:protein UXT homolog n=1 Tax=Schistocerca gregaria TaxID=7010 RepID=UPI00211DD3B0|nr:protein UXT homolog [Schistocerca gregaria]XP_049858351.1 protein UXT homolog [Schistocerca gregaria]XP_049858352.1 protein UXT homolog [Schistocerca gregaria]XP_049858353.1 protein UXT homolog [Schistocerca gregaria]XP_049858354.1 protein UXT homolog [Schistocerca gregaria]XP_049858355.1 protein UXT homolog [Schistocerca gregaria]XP_049858356.1 protein UXT homolog [Schistocerca gregaria]XP_049858357.1 protein UXT homolog [Schistocerca gregaria]